MKILWLAPFPYIKNHTAHPAPWIISLAKALVNTGIELTIVNYNSDINDEILKENYEGINLVYIRTPKVKIDILTFYQIRIRRMKKYLKSVVNNYDLLHIHGSEHQYEAMAYELNIPTVISIQGIISEVIKVMPISVNLKIYIIWKISALYEKKYLSKYQNFSCRTHWDTQYIKKLTSNKAKIFQIWEIIREDFFYDHFSNQKLNILFVGGKNPIKGLVELLQAYNDFLQDLNLNLIILGNCSLEDVRKIITKYQLSSINLQHIKCQGQQDEKGMIKAYEESFCLVHPTYIDNSPNSICEAQLSGLPVIATDVGGVSSLIEDTVTGLLIDNNSKAIGNAVIELLNNDQLRENISKKSRVVARKRHDKKFILKETLDMYSYLIKSNK